VFPGRAVDIGAELFAMTASCVRARISAENGRAEERSAVPWIAEHGSGPAVVDGVHRTIS
jgi:hypothetical protein